MTIRYAVCSIDTGRWATDEIFDYIEQANTFAEQQPDWSVVPVNTGDDGWVDDEDAWGDDEDDDDEDDDDEDDDGWGDDEDDDDEDDDDEDDDYDDYPSYYG